MSRQAMGFALLGWFAVAGCTPLSDEPPPAPAPIPEKDGFTVLQDRGRPTPGPVRELMLAGGTVTAVDGESVTIRGRFGYGAENARRADYSETERLSRWVRMDPAKPVVLLYAGWEVECDRFRHTRDGTVVTLLTGEEVVLREAAAPTRRFPAGRILLEGAVHNRLPGRIHVHRLADVRVGDRVALYLDGALGREECIGLMIHRRPGGRVPYSTVDPEFGRDVIDRYNAYQDHEERGTPIPDRFRLDVILMGKVPPPEPPEPPPAKRP